MKKLKTDDVIISSVFIIMTILGMFFLTYLSENYKIQVLSQALYSKNTYYFVCESKDIRKQELSKSLRDSILFAELDINEDIRACIYDGRIDKPQMKSGRFFEENDFENEHNVAIIGSNYLKSLTEENGISYLYYKNEKYEVVGIMGYEYPTKLDNICLLEYNDNLITNDTVFAIDSKSHSKIADVLQKLNLSNIKQIQREQYNIGSFFQNESASILLITFILFFLIFSNMFISLYWIEQRKKHICIMRLVGYSNSYISKSIFKHLFYLSIVNYAIGIVGSSLLILLLNYGEIELKNAFIVFLLIIFSCCICANVPINKALKYNVILNMRD